MYCNVTYCRIEPIHRHHASTIAPFPGETRHWSSSVDSLRTVVGYRQWKHSRIDEKTPLFFSIDVLGTTADVHILMILMLEGSFCLSSSGILPRGLSTEHQASYHNTNNAPLPVTHNTTYHYGCTHTHDLNAERSLLLMAYLTEHQASYHDRIAFSLPFCQFLAQLFGMCFQFFHVRPEQLTARSELGIAPCQSHRVHRAVRAGHHCWR